MKIYEKNWFVVLMLILFFPVGLYLMWKHTKWNKIVKVIITGFFVLCVLTNMANRESNSRTTINTKETTKQEVTNNSKDEIVEKASEEAQKSDKKKEETKAVEEKNNAVPTEYKSALKSAESYAKMMNMSKAGIYDQLTSEYGEKFPAEAAQYAIDNLQVDWKSNALKLAESYQNNMNMSKAAIYDQLTSEYGEKFTAEEAQYAIDNLK